MKARIATWLGLTELPPDVRHNFAMDSLSAVAVGAFVGLAHPFISVIAVRMGAGSMLIGLISASWVMGMLLSSFWAHLAEGRPKLPFNVWPTIFARSLLLFALIVRTPLTYTLMILAYNFTAAVPGPAYTALIQKIYPARQRGRLMGYVRLFMGLVFAVMSPLGGRILDRYGFRPLFAVAVVFGVASSLVFAMIREPPEGAESVPERRRFSVGELWDIIAKDHVFAWYLVGFTVFGFGNLLLGPAYPIFQVKVLGLTNLQIALLPLSWSLVWLATYPLWGVVADRSRPGTAILAGVALYGVAPVIYLLSRNLTPLLFASMAIGAADAAMDIGWLAQVMKMGKNRVATYAGIHQTALGIRGTVAPLLGAALIPSYGVKTVLFAGAVLILTGLLPLSWAGKTEARAGGKMSDNSPAGFDLAR